MYSHNVLRLAARAPGKRAHLVHTDPEGHPRCPPANAVSRHRRVPPFASSRRPLAHALSHSQWPEPDLSLPTHPQPAWQRLKSYSLRAIRPPDRCGRVRRAVRNSPSDAITCQCVVRRHTCSPVTRRSTRATQARGWCFFSRLTFHKPKSRLGETRAYAAQMIRGVS